MTGASNSVIFKFLSLGRGCTFIVRTTFTEAFANVAGGALELNNPARPREREREGRLLKLAPRLCDD